MVLSGALQILLTGAMRMRPITASGWTSRVNGGSPFATRELEDLMGTASVGNSWGKDQP